MRQRLESCAAALVVMAAASLPAALSAQPGPRTISGVVRDSAGKLLEDAVISLDPSGQSRATRADARGHFRFANVSPGRHELRTSWIGYLPDDRTLEVPAGGLEITVVLAPLPYELDTLPIFAHRTGMFGTVVAHGDFRPLGASDVQVAGTRLRAKSASDGRFSFPQLTAGGYVAEAKRDGFITRLLPFAVPRDDAVEVVLAMDSVTMKSDKLMEKRFRDMERRWHYRSVPNSALVPRQELAPKRGMRLDLALRYAPSFLYKGLVFDNVECVFIDGKAAPGAQTRDYSADDVAFVEVYATGGGGAGGADAAEFQALSGQSFQCGVWQKTNSIQTPDGPLHTVSRAKPGTVSFVWIWLKH